MKKKMKPPPRKSFTTWKCTSFLDVIANENNLKKIPYLETMNVIANARSLGRRKLL